MISNLSIITINFNNFIGLVKTTNSIITQINRPLQWIVIDGGSTDGSLEFLQSIKPNFDYILISESDNGIYDAMNKGLQFNKSPFIIFLNSGDYFVGNVIPLNLNHEILLPYETVTFYGKKLKNKIHNYKYSLPVPHQAIIFKFDINIKYNLDYKIASDYDFFVKYFDKKYSYEIINLTNGYVFYDRGGMSDDKYKQSARERLSIIKFHFGNIYFLKSLVIDALKNIIKTAYFGIK